MGLIVDKRYTGEKETVKLFVDAVQFRRGLARRRTVLCKHRFLCHVFRCYGDEPQIVLYTSCTNSAHAGSKFGTGGSCSFD